MDVGIKTKKRERLMLKEFNLGNRVAMVTGASRGIGKGIALALAEAGANIVALARSEEGINQTGKEVQQLGRRALAIPTDVTKPEHIQNAVDSAVSEFGTIDILVNNAGTAFVNRPIVALPDLPFDPVTEDEWYGLMNLNLHSMYFFARAVGRHMIEKRKGKIVNISSSFAMRGFNYNTPYCASKAAVARFTQVLALEWAKYNIHVNCIAPGMVRSDLTAPLFQNEKLLQRFTSRIPLGRTGEPRDVALLAVYLASGASDWMTGQNIYLDGGETAG
jgi:NAD(P)-dependent dehydrogenase (short-subunit alcohol dehydrogenase family)